MGEYMAMRALMTAIASLFFAWSAFGQANTGTLSGVVTDKNKLPVPGTTIQLKNVQSSAIFRATTGLLGNYTVQLPAGTYELSATSFGFKEYNRKDVVIQAGQTARVDVPMGDFISLDTLGEDRLSVGLFMLSRPQPPTGPTPRMPDGKPDLSGQWYGSLPGGAAQPQGPELQPWAEALARERREHNFKDSPSARCLPFNVNLLSVFLNRIVQTRDHLMVVLEYDIPGYRQVHLDGRSPPKNLEPSWTGYSVGKWEGDTLVVETIGFNDKTWIGEADPHTDKLKVTTRFRRPDLGHLEIETILDDPGAFKKPMTVKGTATLAPASEEIFEFICNENNQDVEHLVGK
jgi:hypothetical protein